MTSFNRSEEIRSLLEQELVARTRKNPRYSLRSYARTLGIGFSDLSKILRRQRSISERMFLRLRQKLPLININPKFHVIAHDQFALVSDWYHFAILSLMRTHSFRSDVNWIARRLAISSVVARVAVERLERLNLIDCSSNLKWRILEKNTTTVGGPDSSAALRNLQTQILEAAIKALEERSPEERDQSTMIMAADSRKLEEARRRIDHFRRQLCNFLETPSADSVFCLSTSLFPMTHGGPQ